MHSAVYTLKEVCLDHCFYCFNPALLMQYTVGSWLWGAAQIELHWPYRDGVCSDHVSVAQLIQVASAQIGGESILAWWDAWRLRWNGQRRKGADSLFALVAWELRKEWNVRCFCDTASTIPQVLSIFNHVTNQCIDAGACNLSCLVRE
jgi:hypothetical protein